MPPATNLDDFGEDNLKKAIKLLIGISSGDYIHPYWQDGTPVSLYANTQNGFVFVEDGAGNTMAINEDKNERVEGFYCNPETGTEGFMPELEAQLPQLLEDDYAYFKPIIDETYNIYGYLAS